MYKYSTPRITIVLDPTEVDITTIAVARCDVYQNGSPTALCGKKPLTSGETEIEMEIDTANNKYYYSIPVSATQNLDANADLEIQFRIKLNDGKELPSKIFRAKVDDVLRKSSL